MAKERGHYKLNQELIQRAARLTALGWSRSAVAEACGVNAATLWEWLQNAETDQATELEAELSKAIQEAAAAGEERLAAKIADGDTRDAQWLLTHSALWRDRWSDAAATRREVQRQLTEVVAAIESAAIPAEHREAVLLAIAARGLNGAAAQ
jgi:transcriptional regulator with XRE-family HTH domain